MDDRVVHGEAKDWRTTPLWGLGMRGRFLHDGRATNVPDASTQLVAIMLLMMAALKAQLYFVPYRSGLLNRLEALGPVASRDRQQGQRFATGSPNQLE